MQKAEHIRQAMQKLGEKGLPLQRVYRCLYSEDLFLTAYDKVGRNTGALTPGTRDDTADGMKLKRIRTIIEALRYEQFRFTPVRRSYIPKRNGGKRPLGIPNFSDKLVQEAVRLILEAYYEPRFRSSSHGFRPGRGCHTALANIKRTFTGTVWFIEGDIRGCFDHIDHTVLMDILSRDVHDGRLLNLIRQCLTAGYLEDWKYEHTYSGTPQGGVLSPLLANIYLHELDRYVEDELIPQHTRGKKRASNPEYSRLHGRVQRARQQGDRIAARQHLQRLRQIPSGDPHDPNYRRLRYIRYADDFVLGFIGPKAEAREIKAKVGAFLKEHLHLEMSETKTLITHATTQDAHFLGYAISVYRSSDKLARTADGRGKRRSLNGVIRLGIPYGLVDERIKRYQRNGKPVQETILTHFSAAHCINTYQQRFRGLAEYYQYAADRKHLAKLAYVMEQALVKTLANKFRTSMVKIYRKYKGTRTVDGHTYKTLQVEIPTQQGKRCIHWGAVTLATVQPGCEPLCDQVYREKSRPGVSDLVQRLQANECELCGSQENCEVHHVRKLADLKKRWQGRREKPTWAIQMIAMHRKTLVVCRRCHEAIHAGRPLPQ